MTLVKDGSAGRGASITLAVMLDGIGDDIEAGIVSLGGGAGRESFLTGRTTWLPSTGFLTTGGGSGRAFEKRERPPGEGRAREEVSILLCAPAMGPLCRYVVTPMLMQADLEHGRDVSGQVPPRTRRNRNSISSHQLGRLWT